jgi:hypothetical protein
VSNISLLFALALWAVLCVGAGTLVSYRLLAHAPVVERLAFRFILGLAAVPTVVIVLHEVFGLRYHPLTVVIVGTGGLVAAAIERRRAGPPADHDHPIRRLDSAIVLTIAAAAAVTAYVGAIQYPTFDGRDPWGHALGIAFVEQTGSLRQADPTWPVIHYVDGYPPLYDILMAFPCEVAGSINHPLKAANAVVVGLATLALWLAARRLTGNEDLAVLASLLYVALPGNLTRQAWGHGIAVVFFLAGVACMAELRRSWRWLLPGAFLFGGALLAAPTQGLKVGVLLASSAAVALTVQPSWAKRIALTGIAALLVAGFWFGPLVARVGVSPQRLLDNMDHPLLRRTQQRWAATADPDAGMAAALRGSQFRRYGLDDFLFFRPHLVLEPWRGTKIINSIVPEGLGVAVTLLVAGFLLAALGRWPDRQAWSGWRRILAVWLVLVVLGLMGAATGLTFYVWRFWLLLCPLACLAAADALLVLRDRAASSAIARVALWLVGVGAAVNVALAAITDVQSGAWRFWGFAPWFLLVPLAVGTWLVRAAKRWRVAAGVAAVAVAAIAGAHVAIAAPARVRALTVFVEPLVFADRVELEGYLRLFELTKPGDAVLPLSGGDRAEVVVGLDRVCRPWGRGEMALERSLASGRCPPPAKELVDRVAGLGYTYLVLDPSLRRDLDQHCPDLDAFRRLAVGLAEAPGVELVASVPDPQVPSTSRWVLYRLPPATSADH